MNKLVLVAFLGLASLSAFASSFECQWLNKGDLEPGVYRPASFILELSKKDAGIKNDSFFMRTYTPCWTGGYASCSFAFELPEARLTVYEVNAKELSLEFESVTGYGAGHLQIQFSSPYKKAKIDQVLQATINGDDGEGTFLNDSYFSCKRLN